MSVSDYVIDVLLIVVIFRQVRPRGAHSPIRCTPACPDGGGGGHLSSAVTSRGQRRHPQLHPGRCRRRAGSDERLADRLWRDERGRLLAYHGHASVDIARSLRLRGRTGPGGYLPGDHDRSWRVVDWPLGARGHRHRPRGILARLAAEQVAVADDRCPQPMGEACTERKPPLIASVANRGQRLLAGESGS